MVNSCKIHKIDCGTVVVLTELSFLSYKQSYRGLKGPAGHDGADGLPGSAGPRGEDGYGIPGKSFSNPMNDER